MPTQPAAQTVVVQGPASTAELLRRHSLVAMTVLEREDLDAFGDASVLDLLQRQPGLTVEDEQAALQGQGSGSLQVLINGQPSLPGFSLASLSPADVARIEIIKGPSAEHGAAGGSLNIVLRLPTSPSQATMRATLAYRGLEPEASVSLAWGGRGPTYSLQLPVRLYNSALPVVQEQLRSTRSPANVLSEQRVLSHDQQRGRGLSLTPSGQLSLDARHSLHWQLLAQASGLATLSQRETAAIAGPEPGTVREQANTDASTRLLRGQGQWLYKGDDGSRLELKALLSRGQWMTDGSSQGQNAQDQRGVLSESLFSRDEALGHVGATASWPVGQSQTLKAGLAWQQRDRRDLRRQFNNGMELLSASLGEPMNEQTQQVSAFVQNSWTPAPRWTMLAGMRLAQWRMLASGPPGDVDRRYTLASPVLSLQHALDAKGQSLLRLGYSRSLRLPDTTLLLPSYSLNGSYDRASTNSPIAADSAGNPLLQPERSSALDLGWEQPIAGVGSFSLTLFHRRIDQLIRRHISLETVAEASVPRWVSRPGNLGQAHSSGVTLSFKGQAGPWLAGLWPQPPKALRLRAELSLYRSALEQVDDPEATVDGQPPWRASLGFDHAPGGAPWGLGGQLVLTPAFATQRTDRQRVWRGASRRLDAYVSWRQDRQRQWRLAVAPWLAGDAQSSSHIDDLDGFAAGSQTRRSQRTSVLLSLNWQL